MNNDIAFGEILEEVNAYLTDNVLAEDLLNIEEDVIDGKTIYYIVLDTEDENGEVSSERICTVYPSVFEDPTYDASSVAEIFSSAFFFLKVMGLKFKTESKEISELKALKQLLKLALNNLLKIETQLLKLVKEEDIQKENISIDNFKAYWAFIENIIGTLNEDTHFSFMRKSTSTTPVDGLSNTPTQEKENVSESKDEIIVEDKSDLELVVNSALDQNVEKISDLTIGQSTQLDVKTDVDDEQKDNAVILPENILVEKLETVIADENDEKTDTTFQDAQTKASTEENTNVEWAKNISDENKVLIVGVDFADKKDTTVYSTIDSNSHYSQEMFAVSK